MKRLVEDYQNRLNKVQEEMDKLKYKFDKVSNELSTVLSIKKGCYKLFIAELLVEIEKEEINSKLEKF
jgi:uncharacterized membrane-anchored protein YhcB (DUF1043 family)